LEVLTEGEAPEGHPVNIRLTPISSTEISVKWKSPHKEQTHGSLLGYYVGHKIYR